jgi:hypothetical protein
VAERVRVDDTAVNGFDVNFVRHERQSSIGAGEGEGESLTATTNPRCSCHPLAVGRSRLSRQPLASAHCRFDAAGAVTS